MNIIRDGDGEDSSMEKVEREDVEGDAAPLFYFIPQPRLCSSSALDAESSVPIGAPSSGANVDP
jgi:hypothetical protein